ncbi:MAG: hypothetical protein U0169_13380 [Polyangiaceae bacterium]
MRSFRIATAVAVTFAVLAACSNAPSMLGGEGEDPITRPRPGADAGNRVVDGAVIGPDGAIVAQPESSGPALPPEDMLSELAGGATQLAAFCAKGLNTTVSRALCATPRPTITSIKDLQALVGLRFAVPTLAGKNGTGGNPAFAMTTHSSSLIARSVSSINPRALVFTPPLRKTPGFVCLSYARGERFLEIAAHDATRDVVNFYLFVFEKNCSKNHACTTTDLLAPSVERDWTDWTIYDTEDLKNTNLDCKHCHQPAGPGTPMILRMQELKDPWTHWFRNDRDAGRAVMTDYFDSHTTSEDYGGIPGPITIIADGKAMEDFVTVNGFGTQPNAYDAPTIEREVLQGGTSATWQRAYDTAARGEAIPVPFFGTRVTDPAKLAAAGAAYRAFVSGSRPDLPDIRDVFLDSALPSMTFVPRPTTDGRAILEQACAQCHNPRLDPTISRAKFDVTKLDTMPVEEKNLAIARMNLPRNDRLHMPPAFVRDLPEAERKAAIQALR